MEGVPDVTGEEGALDDELAAIDADEGMTGDSSTV